MHASSGGGTFSHGTVLTVPSCTFDSSPRDTLGIDVCPCPDPISACPLAVPRSGGVLCTDIYRYFVDKGQLKKVLGKGMGAEGLLARPNIICSIIHVIHEGSRTCTCLGLWLYDPHKARGPALGGPGSVDFPQIKISVVYLLRGW